MQGREGDDEHPLGFTHSQKKTQQQTHIHTYTDRNTRARLHISAAHAVVERSDRQRYEVRGQGITQADLWAVNLEVEHHLTVDLHHEVRCAPSFLHLTAHNTRSCRDTRAHRAREAARDARTISMLGTVSMRMCVSRNICRGCGSPCLRSTS